MFNAFFIHDPMFFQVLNKPFIVIAYSSQLVIIFNKTSEVNITFSNKKYLYTFILIVSATARKTNNVYALSSP